ncbi:MAG: IS1380 family transposase, partial [Roseiarcus sp.]
MMTASNIHYEIAERTRATTHGGIGAIHLLVRKLGLDQAIDHHLGLLKIQLPYHDSDHVLNIAYNLLAGGTCLEHLELLRNDEAYLDALGARRVPDPTTAGDFCRRFDT